MPITVIHASLYGPIPGVEYQVRLGADLPLCAQPYTRAQVEAAAALGHNKSRGYPERRRR